MLAVALAGAGKPLNEEAIAVTLLQSGLSQCRAAVSGDGGLMGSLLVAGLVGSVTHCAGMCGPFVLTQVTARLEAVPAAAMREWHRLAGAALVPYHLGRATTYAGLGAAAAFAGGLGGRTGGVQAALLLAAAVLLLVQALPRLAPDLPLVGALGRRWAEGVAGLAGPWLERPSGWRGYVLGLLLGFIPCGLLWAAITAAAAAADPLAGALGMLAFAAGTVPALAGVGLAGHLAGRDRRPLMARVAPALMLANAAMLSYLAWRAVNA